MEVSLLNLYQSSKPTQPKDGVYAANFRHAQGNHNLQDFSHQLRILKFSTKQRLLAQIKGKLRIFRFVQNPRYVNQTRTWSVFFSV